MNPTLNELLLQAQHLANETQVQAGTEVQRTLLEVLKETSDMHARLTKEAKDSEEKEVKAKLMLAEKGIDLELLNDKVDKLKLDNSIAPAEDDWDTDVAGYLNQKMQDIIMESIEETNANIFKQCERRRFKSRFEEWEMEKTQLLSTLSDCEELARTTAVTTVPAQPGATSLNRTQALYARELVQYHNRQLRRSNLVNLFTKLANKELKAGRVNEMWNVLNHMIKQTPACIGKNAVKSRHASAQFIRHACQYLELGFRQHMDVVIESSKKISACGGIPNIYNRVSSFVRVQFRKPSTWEHLCDVAECRALWPHVFYSLRSGDVQAALQFLKDWNYPSLELAGLMSHEFSDGNRLLSPTVESDLRVIRMQTQLGQEYKKLMHNCSDPFKKAVYAAVLACDVNNSHPEVLKDIDDYLWLQLTVRRKSAHLSLTDVQSLMNTKYGLECITEADQTFTYFQTFVLSGHLEAALEHLIRKDEYEVHAVHMAIALHELSILSISANEMDPLYIEKADDDLSSVCHFNVKRIIINYAKKFERTDPSVSFQYYYLLHQYNAADKRNLMLKCMSNYVLGNFKDDVVELVFGKPSPKDLLIIEGGIFDKLPRTAFYKEDLADMVATELIKRCEYESAVKMYVISDQLEQAMRLINCILAQTVHVPKQTMELRKTLDQLNMAMTRRSYSPESDDVETYKMMLLLLGFFDAVEAVQCREAVEILNETGLIPQTYQQINTCREKTKVLGSDAVKVMPHILLGAMKMFLCEYRADKLASSAKKLKLRERANALLNMIAILPFRLSLDVNRRLVQMELEMQI